MEIVIVGAGGHGKVVLDILRTEGKHKVISFKWTRTCRSPEQTSAGYR